MEVTAQILVLAQASPRITSRDVAKSCGITRQYAQRLLALLVQQGKLIKLGSTRAAAYVLPEHAAGIAWKYGKRFKRGSLGEHEVLNDIESRAQFRASLPENVRSIFEYGFSEMLNNAIDHSESANVRVLAEKSDHELRFEVIDYGIGVFRNVMRERKLRSELEAMQDLLKGKTTTQPLAHSGEGIFFTSKAADVFLLESFGYRLTVDNLIKDVFFEEVRPVRRGTRVTFRIADASPRHLNDVFTAYQTNPSEYAFDKTEIQVRLYTLGTIHVSRSQARRVLSGLERFKSVVLDFDQVPSIGQAFADEIFRVFKARHPGITITPINMNKVVQFMVERVGK